MKNKSKDPIWAGFFTKTILQRGKDYYKRGKAKKVVGTAEGYSITVRGSRNYKVEIYTDEYGWYEGVSCTCPYAQEGHYCKHMAAAFYLMDDQFPDFSQMMEEIFREVPDDELFDDRDYDSKEDRTDHNGLQLPNAGSTDSRRGKSAVSASVVPDWFQDLRLMQEKETEQYLQDYQESGGRMEEEEYRYFHYEDFRKGLVIPRKSLKEGAELLNDSDFNVSVQFGFPNDLTREDMVGEAVGRERYGYYFGTTLQFDRTGITYSRCDRWDCSSRRSSKSRLGHELCKHEAAVLLYLEDYLKNNNPGDGSNSEGLYLMNTLLSRHPKAEGTDKEIARVELRLEPVMNIKEDRRCTASFKVGNKRLYVIKNLSDFMEHMRKGDVMKFGKNTEFQMGRAYIEQGSLPFLDYISDALEEDLQLRRHLEADKAPGAITGEIPLYGNNLDRFYDLVQERGSVEYSKKTYGYKKEKGVLDTREQDYHPSVTISPFMQEKQFEGITLSGSFPDFLNGQKYAYYIEGNYFNRFPLETIKKLEPVLRAYNRYTDSLNLKIGRKHLTDFYRKFLPSIQEAVHIVETEPDLVNRYLNPDPVFMVYLDIDEGRMICRLDAAYGNKIHRLIEEIVTEQMIPNYRDLDKEDEILQLLDRYLPHTSLDLMALFSEPDEENTFLFLKDGLPRLMDLAEVHMTDRFRRLGIRRNVHFNIGVSAQSNLLDLDISAEGYSSEELMEILKAYKRKARYVKLKNGDFLHIDENESVAVLSELMESLNLTPKQFVKGKMHIPAYRALYLDKMMERSQFIEADRTKTFRRLIREIDTASNADYDLPASLEGVLRNYQKEGYQWLRTLDHLYFGGILADEMGLGKTLQVIAVLLAVKEERGTVTALKEESGLVPALKEEKGQVPSTKEEQEMAVCSLIVCPASLVYNWKEELRRFAPDLSTEVIAGTKSMRRGIIGSCDNYDVVITSYDLLKRDIDEYEGKQFRFMVLDEAQYIKNQGTAAARSVKLVLAQTRFALTGTPIENRLSDLWSIFDYLMPGFLYDYGTFRRVYEMPIVKNADKDLSERVSRMVAPFILRRKKKDVLKDLPDKLEEIRYAAMEKTQQKLYDAQVIKLRKSLKKQNDDEFRRNRIQVLSELTRLRQLCCDPSLYYEDYDGGSAKREACMDLVDSIIQGEHKALIFSQFTSMLELLEKDLNESGVPYYKITGATPKEKRIEMVKAFNRNEIPVFLISLKAGGTGLNLTGADVVIHYDPWWNLAVQNQATDRAHRIGQTQIVTVYKLIIKGSIEEKIVEMQETKKQLADDILNSENVASTSISREDLLALLE